jgi:hypothetical protein
MYSAAQKYQVQGMKFPTSFAGMLLVLMEFAGWKNWS